MIIIDLDNDDEYAISILETKEINNVQDLAKIAFYLSECGYTFQAAFAKVQDLKWNIENQGITNEKLFYTLYMYSNLEKIIGDFSNVILYEEEITELCKIIDNKSRKFLYTCLIISKWNNHSSGWTRYDKEAFLKVSDLQIKDYSIIIKECAKNGLLFQVIGSKNPITCYKVNFITKEGKEIIRLHSKQEMYQFFEERLK